MIDDYLKYIQEAGFENMPKGWTKDSVKKAAKTLGKTVGADPKSKGFFDKCVKKLKDKMKDPEGYCATLKDYSHGSTHWRGKGKSEKEAKKDASKHQMGKLK